MRQFAGFGTRRIQPALQVLLEHGVTGLSTAFDMPALMGYDADHPMSRGEVGKEGVAVSSLKDFESCSAGFPLDRVTTSMTINASAIFALCAYVAVAEKQGVSQDKLGGPSRTTCSRSTSRRRNGWWGAARHAHRRGHDRVHGEAHAALAPVSISGYHIREAERRRSRSSRSRWRTDSDTSRSA